MCYSWVLFDYLQPSAYFKLLFIGFVWKIIEVADILNKNKPIEFDLINKKHKNPHLQSAWNKYGEKSFTFAILEIIQDKNNSKSFTDLYKYHFNNNNNINNNNISSNISNNNISNNNISYNNMSNNNVSNNNISNTISNKISNSNTESNKNRNKISNNSNNSNN